MVFHIRPAKIEDCPDLARILIEASDDAFRGLVPDSCLDSLTIEESVLNWRKNFLPGGALEKGEYLFVATTVSNQVTGFAMGGRESGRDDYQTELSVLMVDPCWQKKGIGRGLVQKMAQRFIQAGYYSMLVGVLKENPNQLFYEHLGARKLDEQPFDWNGYAMVESKYIWDDLQLLLSQGRKESEDNI